MYLTLVPVHFNTQALVHTYLDSDFGIPDRLVGPEFVSDYSGMKSGSRLSDTAPDALHQRREIEARSWSIAAPLGANPWIKWYFMCLVSFSKL